MMRLAGATDRAGGDPAEAALRRIALAITKYWVCKRAPAHAAEALECLGGNGYVEESGMPRLYREAPLMSIWEGSGNVAALDALRAMGRQPETRGGVLRRGRPRPPAPTRASTTRSHRVGKELSDPDDIEYRARRVVELMALVLQGAQLVRARPPRRRRRLLRDPARRRLGHRVRHPAGRADTGAILERGFVDVR